MGFVTVMGFKREFKTLNIAADHTVIAQIKRVLMAKVQGANRARHDTFCLICLIDNKLIALDVHRKQGAQRCRGHGVSSFKVKN
ncbi:hypothetical protein ALQ43_200096 [Pseudomonas savastanoi pv. glycinea]|uniref:Uncharacterized protein n=1 Tax=Pseudomonas savastanoi pv. glycinea TaxID=318 RepID=A0A3M5RVA2_PSESG|nr:hypothetical protein ALQ42_200062 [Pseudomonas savastanoi pv. glycinea]RMO32716.1 hypothetical protein ALQ43_200096 [Pseudomonas savastanoi pv. glycinea]RMU12434.1 hypothetical protein ALP34_200048 [Pseudomonas savastanoi pv. glycinea]